VITHLRKTRTTVCSTNIPSAENKSNHLLCELPVCGSKSNRLLCGLPVCGKQEPPFALWNARNGFNAEHQKKYFFICGWVVGSSFISLLSRESSSCWFPVVYLGLCKWCWYQVLCILPCFFLGSFTSAVLSSAFRPFCSEKIVPELTEPDLSWVV
jgi:hypothetical protein